MATRGQQTKSQKGQSRIRRRRRKAKRPRRPNPPLLSHPCRSKLVLPRRSLAVLQLPLLRRYVSRCSSLIVSTSSSQSGRLLNSGTFGSGSVKPPTTKPAPHAADSAAKHPVPPLRRSINSASTKPPMASRPTAASSSSATAARRSSVAPTRTPLSHHSKPTTGVTAASASASHTSASPNAPKATSPARPRASVSDAVKRAPLASRQSLPSSTAKLSHLASAKAPPAKSASTAPKTRTASSISSIREVRDDSKLLEELQTKVCTLPCGLGFSDHFHRSRMHGCPYVQDGGSYRAQSTIIASQCISRSRQSRAGIEGFC